MNKRLIGVAVAALLALLGTVVILRYVSDADERARADVELVEVFVVEKRVNAGADEAELRSAIGTTEVAAGTVVDGVLTDLRQLDGKVAAVDLVAGEQVLQSRLIDAASFNSGRTRLTSVPEGFHEVTVSLEPQRLVGGQVVPGDTVGVLASFDEATINGITREQLDARDLDTREDFLDLVNFLKDVGSDIKLVDETNFLLHQVLVTRVQVEELPQEQVDADGNPVDAGVLTPTGNLLVTLALEADDVERLVYVAENGLLWMSYEPSTADEDDAEATHRGNVFEEREREADPVLTADEATVPENEEAS
jgi:pilus assembly protein CpaB